MGARCTDKSVKRECEEYIRTPRPWWSSGPSRNKKKVSMAKCREPTAREANDGLCVYHTLLRAAKERSRRVES